MLTQTRQDHAIRHRCVHILIENLCKLKRFAEPKCKFTAKRWNVKTLSKLLKKLRDSALLAMFAVCVLMRR